LPIITRATVLVLVIALTLILALRLAFFKARAVLRDDAKIMVCELKVIFGHHPVALHLGFPRKVPIFFEHLRRIATRTVINATAIIRPATGATLRVTTATTATVLTIIDQAK
jgi:hypothetical protein